MFDIFVLFKKTKTKHFYKTMNLMSTNCRGSRDKLQPVFLSSLQKSFLVKAKKKQTKTQHSSHVKNTLREVVDFLTNSTIKRRLHEFKYIQFTKR